MRLEDASLFACDMGKRTTILMGPNPNADLLVLHEGVAEIFRDLEPDPTERFAVPEPCTPEMLLSWL